MSYFDKFIEFLYKKQKAALISGSFSL